jgi:hypothetical protein
MKRGVERIVVLRRDPGDGSPRAQVVYERRKRKGGRRRQSGGLRWLENFTHEAARATSTGADTYVRRHERSNRRKRDGWLRDLPDNVYVAASKGKRRFRVWNVW